MKLSGLSEDHLLDSLLRDLPLGREVVLGPGDDCAAVRVPGSDQLLLLKTDCVIEGTHYLSSTSPAEVGWKALCRALSDIGAMGGVPKQALVTFFSPPGRSLAYWQGVYRGLNKAARQFSVSIVGGETAQASVAALSISVTGSVAPDKVVKRSGGKPGDCLYVTGRLGGSIKGKHLRFTPRLAGGQWLAQKGYATAMMDLSDGLSADLPRLARMSRCSFTLNLSALPKTRDCSVEAALSDGEDYELLFTTPPSLCVELETRWKKAFPELLLTRIGELGSKNRPSTELPGGYDHFLRCQGADKRRSKKP